MILTQKEILKEVKSKRVKITPFEKEAVGPASIDLSLDKEIRIFNKSKLVKLDHEVDYKKYTKLIDITKGYILKPNELVMGITKEKVNLPENLCGWLNSRSKFARIGLMSHITAPFICPGVSNKQVLETYNASRNKIKLMPNIKICQLVLQKCIGKAKYQGGFKNQTL